MTLKPRLSWFDGDNMDTYYILHIYKMGISIIKLSNWGEKPADLSQFYLLRSVDHDSYV